MGEMIMHKNVMAITAEDTEIVVAYHEAGHAVAYWVLHRPLLHVTIIPDNDCLGHVKGGPIPVFGSQGFPGSWDALVRDRAVIALAGPVAERLLKKEPYYTEKDVMEQLTSDDLEVLEMACEHSAAVTTLQDEVCEIDISHVLDDLLAEAIGIIRYQWGAVDAVAKELLTKKTLSSPEFYEITTLAPHVLPPVFCLSDNG